jgi:predicted kinase
MKDPMLIIVTGPPGAGKSTLGRKIARELHLPFFSKDALKDILFEALGWHDRAWSQKVGHASVDMLFHILECELLGKRSVVVETAFIPQFDTARFLELRDKYDVKFVQIYCHADDSVLFERFRMRTQSGERHPGHLDHLISREDFTNTYCTGRYGVLDLRSPFLRVDTTKPETIDDQKVLTFITSTFGEIGCLAT